MHLLQSYSTYFRATATIYSHSSEVQHIRFSTNYDVTSVERKTAELQGINSYVQKSAQKREKTTSGDYYFAKNWQAIWAMLTLFIVESIQ